MSHSPAWLADFESLSDYQQGSVLALIQTLKTTSEQGSSPRTISQGDVFWAEIAKSADQGQGLRHPHVVVQDDLLNHSRIHTVVVCALSTQLKRLNEPGNVALDAGVANLPKPSVVVVSQLTTVAKSQLGEYIGTLDVVQVQQILDGIRFQQVGYFQRL